MSTPSPKTKPRPPILPKPKLPAGNAEIRSPGSPSLPVIRLHSLSPNTSPRPPVFQSNTRSHEPPRDGNATCRSTSKPTFGSCLQLSREKINLRHERELQALECFRCYVHKWAKAEGEHAAALAKIHSLTVREMAGMGTDSSVIKVWNGVLETMEDIQKKHCSTSKYVEETLLGTIDQLIKEKGELLQAYDISRSQLDDEYHTSCNKVQNLRREYFNLLQTTENTKRKLEDTLKRPNAKPDEIDKLRGKFVKNAHKLHTAHNDYTLSLLNVNCHLKHYNTSMLPFCLNALQAKMELFIRQWKKQMESYALTMDMSKVYQEAFEKIFTMLDELQPDEEYTTFIEENKSEPVDEDNYIFDTSLLEGYCSPRVDASTLSINNLTYDTLVAELAEVEQRLEECNKEQSEKAKKLEQLKEGRKTDKESNLKLVFDLQTELKTLDFAIDRERMKLARVKHDIDEMKGTPAPLFDLLGEGVTVRTDCGIPSDRHSSNISGSSSGKTIRKTFKGIMTWINQRSRSQSNENLSLPAQPENTADNDDDDTDHYENLKTGVEVEAWFYPNMERREAELKCINSGDYLVRYSSKQNRYILTVNWLGQGKHFVIQENFHTEKKETEYFLESQHFSSIRFLLEFHLNSRIPVTQTSGVLLVQPVIDNDSKWLIKPEEIKRVRDLGKGASGEVYEAEWKGQRVAVKRCRSTDAMEKDRFFKEVEILKHYDHPNIVKLIGFCWNTEPLIVMELMTGGSLLTCLKKHSGSLSNGKLLRMSIDACCGMKYLETKSCIHRDLATRNCLVGENDIVKISDFGMSHDDCESYQIQSRKQIPIKWTAPEALNRGRYTSASDIWSFGVLLWEMYSDGALPYQGMTNMEAKNKIDKGYRMPRPIGCPEAVYDVMMCCWKYEPQERPNFSALYGMLKDLEETIK